MEILVTSPVESNWCMVQRNLQPNSTHSNPELRMQLKAVSMNKMISDIISFDDDGDTSCAMDCDKVTASVLKAFPCQLLITDSCFGRHCCYPSVGKSAFLQVTGTLCTSIISRVLSWASFSSSAAEAALSAQANRRFRDCLELGLDSSTHIRTYVHKYIRTYIHKCTIWTESGGGSLPWRASSKRVPEISVAFPIRWLGPSVEGVQTPRIQVLIEPYKGTVPLLTFSC